MDTLPSPSGELNELEQRLSDWRPSTTGLDADRMLFGAGRASARPSWGRMAWPIVSGCLTLVAAALAVGLAQERSARLDLTAQLQKQGPASQPMPSPAPDGDESPSAEPPAANSYLASRLAISRNSDAWLVVKADPAEGLSPSQPRIWKAITPADALEPQ